MQEAEQWLPVVGYEGLYEVSSLGRIYSNRRKGADGRFLRPESGSVYDYKYVNLCKGGVVSHVSVHTLVSQAFIGPRPDGLEVRHLDGRPANNVVSNLAYGTHSENQYDRVRHGTHHQTAKTHCLFGHPVDETNTIWLRGGQRQCRTCQVRRNREYRARKKESRARAQDSVDVLTDIAG